MGIGALANTSDKDFIGLSFLTFPLDFVGGGEEINPQPPTGQKNERAAKLFYTIIDEKQEKRFKKNQQKSKKLDKKVKKVYNKLNFFIFLASNG